MLRTLVELQKEEDEEAGGKRSGSDPSVDYIDPLTVTEVLRRHLTAGDSAEFDSRWVLGQKLALNRTGVLQSVLSCVGEMSPGLILLTSSSISPGPIGSVGSAPLLLRVPVYRRVGVCERRWRYQQRGGYTDSDNPAVQFRLDHPEIVQQLSTGSVHDLSPGRLETCTLY